MFTLLRGTTERESGGKRRTWVVRATNEPAISDCAQQNQRLHLTEIIRTIPNDMCRAPAITVVLRYKGGGG